jgi:hypothetical protein
MTETVMTGRNEPCPCGSGKKYKRCCGVNAAPKLTAPKNPPQNMPFGPEGMGGMNQGNQGSQVNQMDQQAMLQFAQALQRLPKGQMQRLQAIMQKAMSGKDVTAEAQEFEKTLPLEFQTMIQSMSGLQGFGAPGADSSFPDVPSMTEEEARVLVAKAAAEGAISKDQAETLLAETEETAKFAESKNDADSKLGRFWRSLSGKKES